MAAALSATSCSWILNGHTWFSVNGRSGATFKDNEGFYEFDLKIKWLELS